MRRPTRSDAGGPMIAQARRFFAPLAAILIATPLVVGLVAPDSPASVLRGTTARAGPGLPDDRTRVAGAAPDARRLAQRPFRPSAGADPRPQGPDKPALRHGNDTVLVGRDGRMFYLGEEAVRQSAGLVLRDQRVADTSRPVRGMKRRSPAAAYGFLVAVPPNSSTVYQDDLPAWAQNHGRATEYDLLVAGLHAKGVRAVDRCGHGEERDDGAYFLHDTHWTPRGALAAFNAVVAADNHPDWALDPKTALGPASPRKGGDLARHARRRGRGQRELQPLALPSGERRLLTADPYGDYVETSGRAGRPS